MAKTKKFPEIEIDHGLIMIKDKNQPLNYLWVPEGRGAYDASFGLCPDIITKEVADEHNKVLDKMLVDGLDNHCEVGQGGMFYVTESKDTGVWKVATFIGTLISDHLYRRTKRFYYFTRNGKEFRGSIRPSDNTTWVERIS